MNPKTKLWEFYHLRSAWDPSKGKDPATVKIPKHATDGSLRMRGRGIVFVLIPGGKFFMGAQDRDEGHRGRRRREAARGAKGGGGDDRR